MIFLILLISISSISHCLGQEIDPVLPKTGVASNYIPDTFYDPEIDYGEFIGRVSDRTKDHDTIKVKFENGNVRFMRAGDLVKFTEKENQKTPCEGFVQGVEDYYLTISVPKIKICREDRDETIRIGTQLYFDSEVMRERAIYASSYRQVLLKQKKDLLSQMSEVNHFLWTFDQQKILTSAEYDRRMVALEKEKQKAFNLLLEKKEEQIILQGELKRELDLLDDKLVFYRIDRTDSLVDRFNLDKGYGLPVMEAPQELIKVEKESLELHRWHDIR